MLDNFRNIDLVWNNAYEKLGNVRTAQFDEKGRKLVVQVTDEGDIVDLTGTELKLVTVDGLGVGGRNYFSYTYHSNRDNYDFSRSYSHSKEPIQLQPNTEYMFSYEELIRFESGQYVLFLIDSSDNRIMSIFNVTGKDSGREYFGADRKRSFTTNDDGLYRFSYYANNRDNNTTPEGEWFTDILLGFQIEKGNIATDWTPAPEDLQFPFDLIDAQKGIYELYFPKLFVDRYTGDTKVFLELTTKDFSVTSEPFYINVFEGVR